MLFFLAKIFCYVFVYVVPRKLLGQRIKMRKFIMFLVVAFFTIPTLNKAIINNLELQTILEGYTNIIIAALIIL